MKTILGEIQSGEFAREWIAENRAGQENFQRMRKEQQGHQIETRGQGAPLPHGLDQDGLVRDVLGCPKCSRRRNVRSFRWRALAPAA